MAGLGIFGPMKTRTKIRHLPTRLATGSFILSSGFDQLEADDETAKALHSKASAAYPFLGQLDPQTFIKLLAAAEITLGSALIIPIVPSRMAGLGLTGFAGGLLGLYMRTPGMRRENSIRPSQQGLPLAKDVWMFGVGVSLVIDRVKPKGRKS